ncbi:MAG: hypothetical protein MJB14_17670 [Spirochaetes bacterium]|nr:hypothetical protein [Spirochaetota bacterium]
MEKQRIDQIYHHLYDNYRLPDQKYKASIDSIHFLSYLIKQRSKMMKWNQKYGIIKPALFNVKFTYHFPKKLNNIFYEQLFPCYIHLEKIIAEGWKWQEINLKEYNLIVLFADFLKKFEKLCEKKTELANSYFDETFFLLTEEAFLKIISSSDYPNQIISALEKVFYAHKKKFFESEDKIAQVISSLENFFLDKDSTQSFYPLIRAYNMVQTKKFLSLSDFAVPFQHEIVQQNYYDCPRNVFSTMITYINSLLANISKLSKEMDEHQWLITISEAEQEGPPFLLNDYYQKCGYSLEKDSQDFFYLFFNLMKCIKQSLVLLIEKEWILINENEKKVELLILKGESGEIIEKLMEEFADDLKSAVERYNTTVLPKVNYLEFKNKNDMDQTAEDKNQYYILEKISQLMAILRQIGFNCKNIADHLDFNSYQYLKYMVDLPRDYRGKFVYQVLEDYTGLLLQCAAFFKENFIIERVKGFTHIKKQLFMYQESLKRVTDSNRMIEKWIGEKHHD